MTGTIDPRRQTTVYRLFDRDGRLLYIGSSVHPQLRWEQHAGEKLWWSSVTRATVDWYPDRASARAAELAAIRAESPLHNDKGTDKEETFPYQGTRGLSIETILRRAAKEHRKALDSLALIVERAALSGLNVQQISRGLDISEAEVHALAERLAEGGGISSIATTG